MKRVGVIMAAVLGWVAVMPTAKAADFHCPATYQPDVKAVVLGSAAPTSRLHRIGVVEANIPRKLAPAWMVADEEEGEQDWTFLVGQEHSTYLLCAYGTQGGAVAYKIPAGTARCVAKFHVGTPTGVACQTG